MIYQVGIIITATPYRVSNNSVTLWLVSDAFGKQELVRGRDGVTADSLIGCNLLDI